MVTWFRALTYVSVSGWRPRPRPPVRGGDLSLGKDGPGLWNVYVAVAYDCRVGDGVEGLVVDSVRGEGLRSRTCDRWSTMSEVMVSGLRKEVVRSAVKMAVRCRSP